MEINLSPLVKVLLRNPHLGSISNHGILFSSLSLHENKFSKRNKKRKKNLEQFIDVDLSTLGIRVLGKGCVGIGECGACRREKKLL